MSFICFMSFIVIKYFYNSYSKITVLLWDIKKNKNIQEAIKVYFQCWTCHKDKTTTVWDPIQWGLALESGDNSVVWAFSLSQPPRCFYIFIDVLNVRIKIVICKSKTDKIQLQSQLVRTKITSNRILTVLC